MNTDKEKQVQKEKDFEPGARNTNEASVATLGSSSGNAIEEAADDYACVMVWINKGQDNEQEFYEYISKASFKAGAEWAASQEVKGNATQQGWISVKDRLPEKPGLYIVGGHTYRELSADGFWRVATFSTYSKEPCFFGMDSFVDYPTHWLVLPPLPEKPNSE